MLYAVAPLVRAAIWSAAIVVRAFASDETVFRLAQLVHAPNVNGVTGETGLSKVRIEVVNVVEDMARRCR